ncbi:hypothetical protein PX699_18475 [Sphingobium sp. H39-3-25]|uniref:hypothetical protein n=1 Tax=Sphingobium arseniciresistens TaxID=3030834 RepID=UPI0023B8FB7E|nr:hypothetical protein [Sphingobium arseniciresistens]|tara:strand:+ start:34287 stop:34751 length:465 start_codon:yes stop_codon:yes gene_type:complete
MAPLSITNPSPFSLLKRRSRKGFDTQGSSGGSDTPSTAAEAYALNLAKLIPGDTIALYSLLNQIPLPAGGEDYHIAPVICVVELFLLRVFATKTKGAAPRWLLVIVSLLTFICWTYVQNDWFWNLKPTAYAKYTFNVLLFSVAFIAPIFIGEEN